MPVRECGMCHGDDGAAANSGRHLESVAPPKALTQPNASGDERAVAAAESAERHSPSSCEAVR